MKGSSFLHLLLKTSCSSDDFHVLFLKEIVSSFVECQKRQAREVFGMARGLIVNGMQPQRINKRLNHRSLRKESGKVLSLSWKGSGRGGGKHRGILSGEEAA